MKSKFDLVGPFRGPCGFCGDPDARHRVYEAIADRLAGGDSPDAIADDYGLTADTVVQTEVPMTDDELDHYSRALDEIWRLRKALAYEASVVAAHVGYKTFPKTRRKIAEEQIERMQAAARGEAEIAYAGMNANSMRYAVVRAGGSETLTRHQWEEERVGRSNR